MENATNTSCDDSSRANYANRLLSRAITERRRPDTAKQSNLRHLCKIKQRFSIAGAGRKERG